jgi:formylglycine-generating enzyme required for sulfatase activity
MGFWERTWEERGDVVRLAFGDGDPPGTVISYSWQDRIRAGIRQRTVPARTSLLRDVKWRNEWSDIVKLSPEECQADARAVVPVNEVSWDNAAEFCRRLAELPEEKAVGRNYRLPTEAEWEYAAGPAPPGRWSDVVERLDDVAWYQKNAARGQPSLLGMKSPNAWGLFDMQGNVAEWCSDWYGADYYAAAAKDNPAGPTTGTERVLRGGAWTSPAVDCRVTARAHKPPAHKHSAIGFRVVAVPAQPK